MKYQNFKSDFVSVHKFYEQEDGAQVQKPVPDHVRLTFFTEERRGFIIVERNGAETDGCSVSDDGLTLSAYVPLSRKFLGMGELICEIAVINADADFPDSIRTVVTPVRMDVTLWPGETNDDSEVESDIVLGFITDTVKQAQTAAETAQGAAEAAQAAAEAAQSQAETFASDASDSASAAAQSLSSMQSTLNGAVATATSEADDAKTAARAAQTAAENAQSQAETFADAAETAAAALTTLVVQEEGQNTDKVMSQKAVTDDLTFIFRTLGKYANIDTRVLSLATSGKYVNTDGGETSLSGYGISAPISVNKGDEILVPSASAVLTACSVVSRKTTRTYAKVINWIFTYNGDKYDTATADYDSSIVYTAVYVDDALTGWLKDGTVVSDLPATRTVTESFYEPLIRQSVAAMPDTGYYVYLADDSMEIVVSGLTATVSGGTVLIHGNGIFKNIVSNFAGHLGVKILCQAIAQLFENTSALAALIDNGGAHKAISYDAEEGFKICGFRTVIYGDGVPSADTIPAQYGIPAFVGQIYINTSAASGGLYYAKGTSAVSDWINA